ncbi:hypothetical protein RND81_03G008200 [Saponaria officinalis]|uniref:Uncharacterized protein n=1 Tax=Saponaria officinalis TaxID=3572 RepID=A0AAW1M1Q9_SAPOF
MEIYKAEAIPGQVTDENYAKGMIYPPFSDIRYKGEGTVIRIFVQKEYEPPRFMSIKTAIEQLLKVEQKPQNPLILKIDVCGICPTRKQRSGNS